MGLENKVVITTALSGGGTFKFQNPAVPYTPEEFAEEAYKAYQSGTSIVHIHAKDPETGMPTPDLNIIRNTVEAIRAKCNVLINLSTAIGAGVSPDDRIRPVTELKPDLASLNTNTMNFAIADHKTGEIGIEIIFENTFAMIKRFAQEMREAKTKPECEVYDIGHVYNVELVRKQKVFEEPLHFQFVFGVAGGIPFNPANFIRFTESLPKDATWSACGVGPNSFPAAFMSAIMGGHIRVGLEDNINITRGEKAKGNYELVEKAVQIAKLAEREIATVEEAREILQLPKR